MLITFSESSKMIKLMLIILVMLANSLSIQGLEAKKDYKFYLLTLGPSHPLYTQGGHSLLRVHYGTSDVIYNWGIFDFNDDFVLNFFQGKVKYMMKTEPTSHLLNVTKSFLPRTIVQNEIHLTPSQRDKLLAKLTWWSNPKNRFYDYHMWKNNCSTQIRDILDDILDHEIMKSTVKIPTTESYRYTWNYYFRNWAFTTAITDLILNNKGDEIPNLWQKNYMPDYLRETLLSIENRDEFGAKQRLLGPDVIIHTFNDIHHHSLTASGYFYFWLFTLFFFILPLLSTIYSQNWNVCKKVYSVGVVFWGLFSFILSIVVFGAYFISNRDYFYFSNAAWFFWPVDIALLIWAGSEFLGKKLAKQFVAFIRLIIYVHIVAALVFLMGNFFPLFEQNNINLLWHILPATFIVYLSSLRLLT